MIAVIFCGGSGTRLWPLSTPDYPKHLLRLNDGQDSLLQATYKRLKDISSKIYLVTDASHAQHVQQQLPKLAKDSFIIEPARRGTASCVVAGLAAIAKHNPGDEPIAFVHADHYIRNTVGFSHSFFVAENVAREKGRIVLVGAEPDHPATGFGYIQKGKLLDKKAFVFDVLAFKEKPDYKLAQQYLKSGNYLWNCGYFVGGLQAFVDSMQAYAPGMYKGYEDLLGSKNESEYHKIYLDFENIAIDYALMEKLKDLLVVPASFDWMDLGSYSDLHKAVENDELGNHLHGNRIELDDVQNCFIHNQEDKPLAIIGLDNVAVVNTPKGMLVTRIDIAQRVGEVSKRFATK